MRIWSLLSSLVEIWSNFVLICITLKETSQITMKKMTSGLKLMMHQMSGDGTHIQAQETIQQIYARYWVETNRTLCASDKV